MKKVTIPLSELFGDCAVNLEGAKKVRALVLMPAFFLLKNCAEADINDYIDAIELDFTGIGYTTQAFMHELLILLMYSEALSVNGIHLSP